MSRRPWYLPIVLIVCVVHVAATASAPATPAAEDVRVAGVDAQAAPPGVRVEAHIRATVPALVRVQVLTAGAWSTVATRTVRRSMTVTASTALRTDRVRMSVRPLGRRAWTGTRVARVRSAY